MICGAKRYIVEMEKNGELKQQSVIAKSPAKARRFIRGEYKQDVTILSVREESKG